MVHSRKLYNFAPSKNKVLKNGYPKQQQAAFKSIESFDMKSISSLLFHALSSLLLATIGFCAFAGSNESSSSNIFNTGKEPSGVTDTKESGNIRVWPIRVSSSVNVSNLEYGDLVIIYSEGGEVAAKATAGNDGFVQIDLSDIEPGIYTVTALDQKVRITKH